MEANIKQRIDDIKNRMIDMGYTAAYGMLSKYENLSLKELEETKSHIQEISKKHFTLDASERLGALNTLIKIHKENMIAQKGKKIDDEYEKLSPRDKELHIASMENTDYPIKKADIVWDSWMPKQRHHFISDHLSVLNYKGNANDLVNRDFKGLPLQIRVAIEYHVNQGRYNKGGKLSKEQRLIKSKGATADQIRELGIYQERARLSPEHSPGRSFNENQVRLIIQKAMGTYPFSSLEKSMTKGGLLESREEYRNVRYEIFYDSPNGYYVVPVDLESTIIFSFKQPYFDKIEDAKEHAELEINGYLEHEKEKEKVEFKMGDKIGKDNDIEKLENRIRNMGRLLEHYKEVLRKFKKQKSNTIDGKFYSPNELRYIENQIPIFEEEIKEAKDALSKQTKEFKEGGIAKNFKNRFEKLNSLVKNEIASKVNLRDYDSIKLYDTVKTSNGDFAVIIKPNIYQPVNDRVWVFEQSTDFEGEPITHSGMKIKFSYDDVAKFKEGGSTKRQMLKSCPNGTSIVEILLSKDFFPTERSSKTWGWRHSYKHSNIESKENYFHLKQDDKSKYRKDSFRTIDLSDDGNIKAIVGCPKSNVKSKLKK